MQLAVGLLHVCDLAWVMMHPCALRDTCMIVRLLRFTIDETNTQVICSDEERHSTWNLTCNWQSSMTAHLVWSATQDLKRAGLAIAASQTLGSMYCTKAK